MRCVAESGKDRHGRDRFLAVAAKLYTGLSSIPSESWLINRCTVNFYRRTIFVSKPTTIEQTSKRWKLMRACAGFLLLVGWGAISSGAEHLIVAMLGMLALVVGLFLFFAARVGAWWDNG